jgi:para-nitrobenzyl esterase
MVWIHGGALVTGESDDYDPTALVSRGVIVVTINYRLGALGFLVQSALAADPEDQGAAVINYGLRDQQAALRWVEHNIHAFGGDPRNVTVFGESAGGLSTLSQIASPGAAGLISKAIVESGAYALALPALAASEAAGASFATAVGCADQSASCLRAVPVATILANETAAGYVPTVDGIVLPLSLGTAFSSGRFNRVPVLMGSNHDEWRLFVALDFDLVGSPLTDATYAAVTDATFGAALGPVLLAQYPVSNYASPDLAWGALGTDYVFACSSRLAIQSLAQYVSVFAYQFADENAPQDFLPPVSFPYGAAHASELQYLFNLRSPFGTPLSAAQQTLSGTMVDYWAHFAKDSDPNQSGTPYWPRYTAQADEFQSFVPNAVTTDYLFSAFHKCDFWTPILTAAGG